MLLKRIPVLTIFRRGMMSCVPFSKKLRKTLLRSLELPINLLSFWTRTTLLALKTSVWTLKNASLKLTSAPSSSILVLQALFFRRALKMSTSRMMLLPNLLRTSLILEITLLSKRQLKYYLVIVFFFFFKYLSMRSVVLDHLNLSKYI